MENTFRPPTYDLTCANCASPISDEKYCSACGYPIQGTDQEKSDYRANVARTKYSLSDAQKKVKEAKTVIYILAGIFFLFGMVQGIVNDDMATLTVNVIMTILYLIFARWCDTNPFGAILTAFLVYITVQLINVVDDPASIFAGILWKVLIIIAFVKGIRSAQEAQGYMKDLARFKGKKIGN